MAITQMCSNMCYVERDQFLSHDVCHKFCHKAVRRQLCADRPKLCSRSSRLFQLQQRSTSDTSVDLHIAVQDLPGSQSVTGVTSSWDAAA